MGKTLRFNQSGKSIWVSKETILRERSAAWTTRLIEAKTKVEQIEKFVAPLVDRLDISIAVVRVYAKTEIREKFSDQDELLNWLVEAINLSHEELWRARPVHYLAIVHEFIYQDYRAHKK